MTLRMTWTRKDLRANEGDWHGWMDEDPLTLADLPPMADENAPFSPGPFDGPNTEGRGLVKKIWRMVKRV